MHVAQPTVGILDVDHFSSHMHAFIVYTLHIVLGFFMCMCESCEYILLGGGYSQKPEEGVDCWSNRWLQMIEVGAGNQTLVLVSYY